jgi:hypothetical protein
LDPLNKITSWLPHQSVVGGAVLGQLIGQAFILAANQYLSKPPSPELATVVSSLITIICVYFIPDKPRS